MTGASESDKETQVIRNKTEVIPPERFQIQRNI